jgi:hypothetical protein
VPRVAPAGQVLLATLDAAPARLSATVYRGSRGHPDIFAGCNHGLIVADNGSDMYITGAMDPRWNNDELNPAFGPGASDFEVVR